MVPGASFMWRLSSSCSWLTAFMAVASRVLRSVPPSFSWGGPSTTSWPLLVSSPSLGSPCEAQNHPVPSRLLGHFSEAAETWMLPGWYLRPGSPWSPLVGRGNPSISHNGLAGCRSAPEEEISDRAGLGRHLRCPVLGGMISNSPCHWHMSLNCALGWIREPLTRISCSEASLSHWSSALSLSKNSQKWATGAP